MQLEWALKKEAFPRHAIINSLNQIDKPSKKISIALATCILQLLACNCKSAPCLFDTLLYYLERHNEITWKNIVFSIGEIVDEEANTNQIPYFTSVVKNIICISHGCGLENNKVRAHLHH